MKHATVYAVQIATGYLMGQDEDGRPYIPLYGTREDATEAAERSDLDEWKLIPIRLEEVAQ